RRPPSLLPPTLLSSLLPYTTLFRSLGARPVGYCHLVPARLQPGPRSGRGSLPRPAARLGAHEHRMGRRCDRDFPVVHWATNRSRSEEHTSELQSRFDLVCRLLLEKK